MKTFHQGRKSLGDLMNRADVCREWPIEIFYVNCVFFDDM